MNPFYYGQIVKDENFCRRPELVEKLGDNIKRGQNVYIQGVRRTGKSSLIFETIR
jgi:AAA+ ATPase superfamily predicted ATPase